MKKHFLLLFLLVTGTLSAQWYNLQWPPTANINEGDSFNVYAQIWIDGVTSAGSPGVGITAWIGVNSENTDPSTWDESAWTLATFNGDAGNNDEFTASIGSDLPGGEYYYASRFLYSPPTNSRNENGVNDVTYWYGGIGGPWNNDSGVLTVNALPSIGWANLQWPPSASIMEGDSADVYAQVWMDGVTSVGSPGEGINGWIGVSSTNNNPANWPDTAWKVATFNGDVGNNDEFTAAIGNHLSEGTYYYASRFLYSPPQTAKTLNTITNGENYYYGGYSGGAWDSVNNVSGVLTVNALPDTVIDWANLQWPPQVELIDQFTFTVYGQIYESGVTDAEGQGAGIEAWFGLSEQNSDPSLWSNDSWQPASFNVDVGNNDEYTADLNIVKRDTVTNTISIPSEFYYAARYRLNGGDFYYGAFQGGAWDGTNNVNGEGTFSNSSIGNLGWCNLQWPPTMSLEEGQSGDVYAQMWINGITSQPGATMGVQVYVGVNSENTDPATWSTEVWIPATFNTDVGNNDEFVASIGNDLGPGTYYYASRFSVGGIKSFYGGYNAEGGGFWDGTNNISGVLTITQEGGPSVDWCNLQWPVNGNIEEGTDFIVYAQTWIADVTSIEGATPGLSAWIGVNSENTDPAEWDESAWMSAEFNVDAGNNDEFMANIGPSLASGTYYYASRFQFEDGSYKYGGYNEGGGGFWDGTTNVSGSVIVDPATSVEEDIIPTVYALDQNYPNPFNPATSIRFSIPIQSNVVMKIYNIMGEEVAILQSGTVESGIHEVNWDASELSSGVYILRISAAATDNSKQFIDMKKMILMK